MSGTIVGSGWSLNMSAGITFTVLLLILTSVSPAGLPEPPRPSGLTRPQSTQATPPSEAASRDASSASAAEPTLFLKEGTPVRLKLLHTLNSKTVVPGDPLNFSVAEDVVADGKTLVKAGAPAIGRVRNAKPARTLGRGAELGLEMQYLKAGRTRVPLRGSQGREGEAKTADTVALTVLFGLSGLVKHGSEIEVKEGSLFTAYVGEDTAVQAPSGTTGRESK
jgi:hypothetical protein